MEVSNRIIITFDLLIPVKAHLAQIQTHTIVPRQTMAGIETFTEITVALNITLITITIILIIIDTEVFTNQLENDNLRFESCEAF